jgi:hypothetical protein
MISVLIPLGTGSKIDNWELRHTLRSMEQNFDFEYTVTIYSETPIDWVQNVTVTQIPRFYPEHLLKRWDGTKHYENYYDTLNKLFVASSDSTLDEEVLYVYDDVLLLQKQDYKQIKKVYAGGMYKDNPNYWLNPRGNKWRNTIFQAIDRAKGYGEVYLYETHLPRVYHKSKLAEMFKTFPIKSLEIPYAPATLYFNMFYDKPDMNFKPVDKTVLNNDIKAGFYGTPNTICDCFPSKHMAQVMNAVQGKIWVNYNDSGLSEPLKQWIQKQFPNKSRYEK